MDMMIARTSGKFGYTLYSGTNPPVKTEETFKGRYNEQLCNTDAEVFEEIVVGTLMKQMERNNGVILFTVKRDTPSVPLTFEDGDEHYRPKPVERGYSLDIVISECTEAPQKLISTLPLNSCRHIFVKQEKILTLKWIPADAPEEEKDFFLKNDLPRYDFKAAKHPQPLSSHEEVLKLL